MTELWPMNFEVVAECFAHHGIFVDEDFDEAPGCRVFRRPAMGLGTPYYTVACNGDDEPIHPPTLARMLLFFSIPEAEFIETAEKVTSEDGTLESAE